MVDKVNHSPNTNFMAGSATAPDEFGQRVQAVRRFNRFYTRQIGMQLITLLPNASLRLPNAINFENSPAVRIRF